jgi:mannose-6-phosphate isomerase-like protein (cupin superfamily)
MQIVHTDTVIQLPNGAPDYDHGNPLLKLLGLMERSGLAAEREHYAAEQLQYLFPFNHLDMYPPAGSDASIVDPTVQDNKTDFQKQNIRDFATDDTELVRGYATAGDWTGAFLRLSYRGGPDSVLSAMAHHDLGAQIKVWVKVGGVATPQPIPVNYNSDSGRYEVELWSFPGSAADLRGRLDQRGQAALDRGTLLLRPDLVHGDLSPFQRSKLDDAYMIGVAPDHAMHPILPLHVAVAWADQGERFWDSRGGQNHQYEFNMIVRGWDAFLGVGNSANPHGGVGSLEYRNLMSNYGRYAGRPELSRTLEAWNFDAFGRKGQAGTTEPFMAVDYMDLHRVRGGSGIGLHRHRDNQEVFLLMEGTGLMVVGDFCELPARERCFEIRTLRAGHFAMLKGGNLHSLMNPTDEPISLFMFGGYD